MKKGVLFLFVLMLVISQTAQGTTYYIKDDGSGDQPTIQAGIDACLAGDTVLVAPGTYTGSGNRDINFNGKAIVVMSEMGAATTIIDCQGSSGDEHRGFCFVSGEDSLSIVQGFTIIHGHISIGGGGIYCLDSSPIIRNNIIKDNWSLDGAGIYCQATCSQITNNEIFDNNSGEGGGVYCSNDSSYIIENEIHDNLSNSGGGIYCASSAVIINSNNIYRNNDYTSFEGGGIYCIGGIYEIKDNIINQNSVNNNGAGILCSSCDAYIENNTFTNNWGCSQVPGDGGALLCQSGMFSIIGNTITDSGNARGGGIYINSSDSCFIANNIISNNCGEHAPPMLFHNQYYRLDDKVMPESRASTWAKGGGICAYGSGPIMIEDNIINGNASYIGGGIYCNNNAVTIKSNLIYSNSALGHHTDILEPGLGGGICCDNSSPVIVQSTFYDNSVSSRAGGDSKGGSIYCSSNSSPTISKCIISRNNYGYDTGEGGGIYTEDGTALPYISCCDVYDNNNGNYGGYLSDQTGLNGNISLDPRFCELGNEIFSLRSDSPCLPGSHPDRCICGLIGYLGLGCTITEPVISFIEDVLNDQGRQVSLRWYRSSLDSMGGSPLIMNYEIYRRLDDLPSSPPVGLSAVPDSRNGGGSGILTYPEGDWYFVMEVPAHGEDSYNVIVPTLEDSCSYNDSTLGGDPLYFSTFFVRAASASPSLFYESEIDGGYSVDNLSPAPPLGLAFTSGNILEWEENVEPDLAGYHVYAKEHLDSLEVHFLGKTVAASFDISASIGDGYHHWAITAVDLNGNESNWSSIQWYPTGDDPRTPMVYALRNNYPNPFNPITTIAFDLPERTRAELSIYTIDGRQVITLLDGILEAGYKRIAWNGLDQRGRRVSSGVYFYQLSTDKFKEAKKMILIR